MEDSGNFVSPIERYWNEAAAIREYRTKNFFQSSFKLDGGAGGGSAANFAALRSPVTTGAGASATSPRGGCTRPTSVYEALRYRRPLLPSDKSRHDTYSSSTPSTQRREVVPVCVAPPDILPIYEQKQLYAAATNSRITLNLQQQRNVNPKPYTNTNTSSIYQHESSPLTNKQTQPRQRINSSPYHSRIGLAYASNSQVHIPITNASSISSIISIAESNASSLGRRNSDKDKPISRIDCRPPSHSPQNGQSIAFKPIVNKEMPVLKRKIEVGTDEPSGSPKIQSKISLRSHLPSYRISQDRSYPRELEQSGSKYNFPSYNAKPFPLIFDSDTASTISDEFCVPFRRTGRLFEVPPERVVRTKRLVGKSDVETANLNIECSLEFRAPKFYSKEIADWSISGSCRPNNRCCSYSSKSLIRIKACWIHLVNHETESGTVVFEELDSVIVPPRRFKAKLVSCGRNDDEKHEFGVSVKICEAVVIEVDCSLPSVDQLFPESLDEEEDVFSEDWDSGGGEGEEGVGIRFFNDNLTDALSRYVPNGDEVNCSLVMQLFNLIGGLTDELKRVETDCVEIRAELERVKQQQQQKENQQKSSVSSTCTAQVMHSCHSSNKKAQQHPQSSNASACGTTTTTTTTTATAGTVTAGAAVNPSNKCFNCRCYCMEHARPINQTNKMEQSHIGGTRGSCNIPCTSTGCTRTRLGTSNSANSICSTTTTATCNHRVPLVPIDVQREIQIPIALTRSEMKEKRRKSIREKVLGLSRFNRNKQNKSSSTYRFSFDGESCEDFSIGRMGVVEESPTYDVPPFESTDEADADSKYTMMCNRNDGISQLIADSRPPGCGGKAGLKVRAVEQSIMMGGYVKESSNLDSAMLPSSVNDVQMREKWADVFYNCKDESLVSCTDSESVLIATDVLDSENEEDEQEGFECEQVFSRDCLKRIERAEALFLDDEVSPRTSSQMVTSYDPRLMSSMGVPPRRVIGPPIDDNDIVPPPRRESRSLPNKTIYENWRSSSKSTKVARLSPQTGGDLKVRFDVNVMEKTYFKDEVPRKSGMKSSSNRFQFKSKMQKRFRNYASSIVDRIRRSSNGERCLQDAGHYEDIDVLDERVNRLAEQSEQLCRNMANENDRNDINNLSAVTTSHETNLTDSQPIATTSSGSSGDTSPQNDNINNSVNSNRDSSSPSTASYVDLTSYGNNIASNSQCSCSNPVVFASNSTESVVERRRHSDGHSSFSTVEMSMNCSTSRPSLEIECCEIESRESSNQVLFALVQHTTSSSNENLNSLSQDINQEANALTQRTKKMA